MRFETERPLDEQALGERNLAEGAAALEALKQAGQEAAKAIDDSFAEAGASLARSLARAAADGEISLAELARAVLGAVNAAYGGHGSLGGGGELAEAIGQAVSGAFSGARADGGPVLASGSYLVGERGPELFRPSHAGSLEAPGGRAVTVNVTVQGDAAQLLRSEAQIAQALARAVSLGVR
ncbi:phage tail tape measure protein [Brevundimonas sp. 2R-24]|uniref:Phage tail tape measure protein n=1 Tax=Peiella sedimenti TaxID=3061083 RepID=A0ABT8SHR7_9CAUL|nr:phage tail tape measure protein [Caulobacteraceae bacterium XZ-24]